MFQMCAKGQVALSFFGVLHLLAGWNLMQAERPRGSLAGRACGLVWTITTAAPCLAAQGFRQLVGFAEAHGTLATMLQTATSYYCSSSRLRRIHIWSTWQPAVICSARDLHDASAGTRLVPAAGKGHVGARVWSVPAQKERVQERMAGMK